MTYVILNYTDVTQSHIDDCVQTSNSTLRHSMQGTDRVVLKYIGTDPSWITSLSLTKYTHAEILIEMAGVDWHDDEAL